MSTRDADASTAVAPAAEQRRHGSGFWIVAFAFLIVMAFATLPSPLYGLYRTRDHLSTLTITVVYAVFAGGTIATLLGVGPIARRVGRRGVMLGAVGTMMAGAVVLAAWKELPGLVIGRLLTGVSVGLVASTAITYLIELRLRADPTASVVRARTIGTSVNVGALGIGPLIAGCLAQWARWPLTLSYLVFIALGALMLVGLAAVPETGSPRPRLTGKSRPVAAAADPAPASATDPTLTAASASASTATSTSASASASPRTRLPLPAAAATLAAFSASGLFAGLSGLFLATTLRHPSLALSGTTLFVVFSSGVVSQVATTRLRATRVLGFGTISMLVGLALLVVAVRLPTPDLASFLVAGALIGAGVGAVFKGTTGVVLETAAPEHRLAMTSELLIALFVGLSVPVIGAGVALKQGATPPDTVLGFAVVVGLGVSVSGWALLR